LAWRWLDVSRVIEAVYEKGVLRPLERLDLPDGIRVRLRIVGIYGLLKDWRIDPQALKDELRGLHG
jgi:predicted DNA-binding antitoxin AbrB/MazE fold protein